MIFTWYAVTVPSRLAPIFTCAIWSRPWCVTAMFSVRVSIHLTGCPVLREAQAQNTSSP